MGDLGRETESLAQCLDQSVRVGEWRLTHPAAATAYDVQVSGVLDEVIARGTVVDVRVAHQAELGQRIKRAVDRRRGQTAAISGGKLRNNLVRSRVPQVGERTEDAGALRSEAHPLRPQEFPQIRHSPTVCRTGP